MLQWLINRNSVGLLWESVLHRYARSCNVVRGRPLILYLKQSVNIQDLDSGGGIAIARRKEQRSRYWGGRVIRGRGCQAGYRWGVAGDGLGSIGGVRSAAGASSAWEADASATIPLPLDRGLGWGEINWLQSLAEQVITRRNTIIRRVAIAETNS